MKHLILVLLALVTSFNASAGCVGPVIMGECKGEIVPWDTHPLGQASTPAAPPGSFYDKRGTNAEQLNPGSVNPFTGRDAHDTDMDAERRMRCFQRREEQMRRGVIVTCP